jgi:hypothetical protein
VIFSAVRCLAVAYRVVSDVEFDGEFESEVRLPLSILVREIMDATVLLSGVAGRADRL